MPKENIKLKKNIQKYLAFEGQKDGLINMARLNMCLENYHDIFSDFDPRSYSQRTMSDDFLAEAKKAVRETASGQIELDLLVPAKSRNLSYEYIIKKRIKDHFKNQYSYLIKHKKKIFKQSLIFILLGIICMVSTAAVLYKLAENNFFRIVFPILAEPAGWFFFWEGLDLIVFFPKEKKSELDFNEKMSRANVNFRSY